MEPTFFDPDDHAALARAETEVFGSAADRGTLVYMPA
jgi:hypothetical protein